MLLRTQIGGAAEKIVQGGSSADLPSPSQSRYSERDTWLISELLHVWVIRGIQGKSYFLVMLYILRENAARIYLSPPCTAAAVARAWHLQSMACHAQPCSRGAQATRIPTTWDYCHGTHTRYYFSSMQNFKSRSAHKQELLMFDVLPPAENTSLATAKIAKQENCFKNET